MNLSPQGVDLLKKFEGFRSKPYKCSAGYPTIGYGHQINPHEKLDEVTIDQANSLLKQDVLWAERAINARLPNLTQNQFDALVCFVFNIGVSAFEKSSVLRFARLRDYKNALDYWAMYVHDGKVDPNTGKPLISRGLQNRRNAEIALFKSAS
jgi:lysozyme